MSGKWRRVKEREGRSRIGRSERDGEREVEGSEGKRAKEQDREE